MSAKISRTLERTVLDNGVRVLSSYMKGETVAFGFGFDYGAIFDTPEFDGLLHLVEHLLLKAAPGYPYRRASRLLEETGKVTAETDKVHILVPHLTVVGGRRKANFKRTFRVLSKLVAEPTFNEQEFHLEKEAVLREIEEDDASPMWHAYLYLCESIFGKESPLSQTIVGKAEVIRRLDRDTVLGFCRSLFDPNHVIILSHGQLPHKTLVQAAESFFRRREKLLRKEQASGIISSPVPSLLSPDDVKAKVARAMPSRLVLRPEPRVSNKLPEELGGIAIGCRVPEVQGPEYYALEILKCIMGGSVLEDAPSYSGDVFYELREKHGLLYHPEVEYESHASRWPGCFYVNFETNRSLLEQAEERLIELFRSYRRDGISRDKIKSAQRKIDSEWRILRTEHKFQFLGWMLESEIGGRPAATDEYLRNIKKVTRRTVMEVLEKYFDPDTQLVRAFVYPAKETST